MLTLLLALDAESEAQLSHPFLEELREAYKDSKLLFDGKVEGLLFRQLPKPPNELERLGQISQPPNAVNKVEERVLDQASDALARQFFNRVKRGERYYPVEEIKRLFGQSPEERIGVSSGGYYRLFVAYWTLKAKLRNSQQTNISQHGYANIYNFDAVLSSLESGLAGAFFPTPGPAKIPEKKRREGVQEILNAYAPKITIKELYEGADPRKVPWQILK